MPGWKDPVLPDTEPESEVEPEVPLVPVPLAPEVEEPVPEDICATSSNAGA